MTHMKFLHILLYYHTTYIQLAKISKYYIYLYYLPMWTGGDIILKKGKDNP